MKKRIESDWRDTEQGRERYRKRRAEAQQKANESGLDCLLTKNDYAKDYFINYLPRKENRYGRDLDGEVVSCEVLGRCQLGHGPCATR